MFLPIIRRSRLAALAGRVKARTAEFYRRPGQDARVLNSRKEKSSRTIAWPLIRGTRSVGRGVRMAGAGKCPVRAQGNAAGNTFGGAAGPATGLVLPSARANRPLACKIADTVVPNAGTARLGTGKMP